MGWIASWMLFIGFLAILCQAEDIHWPNFSCHAVNSSIDQNNAFYYNKMGWRSCLEKYEKYKGNCAYICMIWKHNILLRKESGGPISFDVDMFMKYFAREVGYRVNGTDGPELERMRKVQLDMDACKIKHPEYEGMKSLRKTECGPWKNFLACFDTAIGCGVWKIN